MNVYFTSDLHLGHELMRKLRGFDTIKEMNEFLIDSWNSKVSKKDHVYCLGDLSLEKDKKENRKLLYKLNGQITLIRGNHDTAAEKCKERFQVIKDIGYIKIKDQKIFMCHYPVISWRGSYRGSFCCHGHCHGNLKFSKGKMYDVGVDNNNFQPLSFQELKAIMDQKAIEYVDEGEEV